MTRDEHIKIEMDRLRAGPAMCGQHPGIVREVAEANVNCFVRHGILRLDEPKISDLETELPNGYIGKVRSFMRKFGLGGASPIELERALDAADLRIVEK